MKFVRFLSDGRPHFGLIKGDRIEQLAGSYFDTVEPTGRTFSLSESRLLCPVTPSKVVCCGLNYRDHAAESGQQVPDEPCLFIKPDTSVIGPEEAIVYPEASQRVDYEAELGIVIGKTIHRAAPHEVKRAILGYTCLNDVTARDLQAKDQQWTRAKGFDTFCPIGPCVTDEIDPDAVEIELFLNGERRQHSNTRELVFKTAELVSRICNVMTLKPGDVIGAGTPSGIGPMQPGDAVEVRIEGVGSLRNTVRRV